MATVKDDGTAAAAQQLGSISLGESAGGDDNTEPNANGTPTKLRSACGKKSDALMKCRACKCVWYCDKDCQNKHWKGHKKECRRIKKELDKRGGKLDLGTELDVGPLEKVPSREECAICMQVPPIHSGLQAYFSCCSKTICCGCDHRHEIKSGGRRTCAFCRTAMPRSDEEALVRLRKRVALKDPVAMHTLAMNYSDGDHGLSVDQAKCIELLFESAGLGCPRSQYQLGDFYDNGEMGLEQNKEEALKYWVKAAEGGHLVSRHNLGTRMVMDDVAAAMCHWRLSASGGLRPSMVSLIVCFENGVLHHADLAETLQFFFRSRAEMKSEERHQWIKHLKTTGEYKEEYDI